MNVGGGTNEDADPARAVYDASMYNYIVQVLSYNTAVFRRRMIVCRNSKSRRGFERSERRARLDHRTAPHRARREGRAALRRRRARVRYGVSDAGAPRGGRGLGSRRHAESSRETERPLPRDGRRPSRAVVFVGGGPRGSVRRPLRRLGRAALPVRGGGRARGPRRATSARGSAPRVRHVPRLRPRILRARVRDERASRGVSPRPRRGHGRDRHGRRVRRLRARRVPGRHRAHRARHARDAHRIRPRRRWNEIPRRRPPASSAPCSP